MDCRADPADRSRGQKAVAPVAPVASGARRLYHWLVALETKASGPGPAVPSPTTIAQRRRQCAAEILDRADGNTPDWQEPGTGLDDAPLAHPTGLTSFHPAQHSNSSLLTATTL